MPEPETCEQDTQEETLDTTDWPGLHSMRKMGKYSDLILVVGKFGALFSVHRNVLIDASNVFKQALENLKGRFLNLPQPTDAGIKVILEFLYSGKVPSPLPFLAAIEAFIASVGLLPESATIHEHLAERISECIRDPNRFCNPSSQLKAENAEPIHDDNPDGNSYMKEIKELSKGLACIFKVADYRFKHCYAKIFREIRMKGVARDVLQAVCMDDLICGEPTEERLTLLQTILGFYYDDDEAIRNENGGE